MVNLSLMLNIQKRLDRSRKPCPGLEHQTFPAPANTFGQRCFDQIHMNH